MNERFTLGRPSTNPIAQAFAFVLAGALLVGAVFMGFLILAVLLGVGAILGVVLWLRIWWFRRKMRSAGFGSSPFGSDPAAGSSGERRRVIDVEYRVVDDDGDSNESER